MTGWSISKNTPRWATCGSRSLRSSAFCTAPAGTPCRCSSSMTSWRSRSRVQAATWASSASWLAKRSSWVANRGSAVQAACRGPRPDRPLLVVEHGDGDPAVLAQRRVDAVRRGVRPLEPVAGREVGSAGRAPVDRHVEQDRAEQVDAGLDGRHVDLGALPGAVAPVDRHQQGRGVVVGRLVVHVRQAPAGRLPTGKAADVATARSPPARPGRSCGTRRAGRSARSRSCGRR